MNEAAERLRRMMRLNQMPMEWLDNALAAERGNDYATGFRDGRDMERGNHKPDALAAERRAQAKRDRDAVYGCNTIWEARRWLDEEATR